jgi:hypothetical protein
MFAMLAKETRPAFFFGAIGSVFALVAFLLFLPVFIDYLGTGEVERFPTAFLSMGLVLVGTVSAVCGLILDSLSRARIEQKRSVFLSYPALQWR